MNNMTNEQHIHSIQVSTVQQSVEEAYLNSLLSPLSIEGCDAGGRSESQHIKPEAIDEPVRHEIKNDVTDPVLNELTNSIDISNVVDEGVYENRPQVPFACQVITVAGIKLALPLSSFTQVFPWPEVLKPTNSKNYIAGHIQHGACVFDIVDLSGLIMDRPITELVEDDESSYSHVILLQDGSTCLPCDETLEVVTVNPDKVCWRTSNSKRAWLAGTIKDEQLALLDADKIMRLLGKS